MVDTEMEVFAQQVREVSGGGAYLHLPKQGDSMRQDGHLKVSITAHILIDILCNLDYLQVFDRLEGRTPFLLLDR